MSGLWIMRCRRLRPWGGFHLQAAAFNLAVLWLALIGAATSQPASDCTGIAGGGNAIAFSLDSSGSIRTPDFLEAQRQIVAFIDQTSGVNASSGANSNQYYLNIFTTGLAGSTGAFQTNAGGRASQAVAAISETSGGTTIAAGIDDLTVQFQGLPGSASLNKIAVILTDGDGGPVLASADALRAEGVTVVAVGLGTGPSLTTLEEIASTGANGGELVFDNAGFDQIEALVVEAIENIDTDDDGVNDCEDECRDDPNKSEPGACGCGEPEVPGCGQPATDPDCVGVIEGGNAIAFSLDASGSIDGEDFQEAKDQIVAFISQTSASNASTGANSNLYYLNIFDDAVRGDTGSFQTNAGGRVTRAIQAIAQTGGGTDFSDGVDDLTAQFQGLTGSASFAKIAVVLTDGQSGGAVAASAAALRAEGVTVAAVGLGPNPTASVLSDIASSEDLVFTNVNFDAIRALILQVLTIVDTDGDGTNDCEDGCPNDALKTEPGVCGCDEPEVPRCGDPLPPDIPFTGGGIIAISIDCSSSVTETEFILARTRVVAFIDLSSGVDTSGGINSNLYYVSCFSTTITVSTGSFLPNTGRQVSALVEELAYQGGGTDIAAALDDLAVQFRQLTVTASALACVVTGGTSSRASVVSAGLRLRASFSGGVTIAGIAVGAGAGVSVLQAVADTAVDGVPLVAQPTVFGRVDILLVSIYISIDTDGDGVTDAEDGCPADIAATAPTATGGCNIVPQCTGGTAIGISLDTSSSVSQADFTAARQQVIGFVDATSGVGADGTANSNLYYANTFTTTIQDTTADFRTNANRRVSRDIQSNLDRRSGGTAISAGLADLGTAFAALDSPPAEVARVAVVVTDGNSDRAAAERAADALRADGATVVAVAVGSGPVRATLEAIASPDSAGDPLVFETTSFDEIAELLAEALALIDTDGDGVPDCEDAFPTDPTRS